MTETRDARTITEERLTRVLYDWMPDGAGVSLGFNGDAIHLTGSDLSRFLLDRDAEYPPRPTEAQE